MSLSLEQLKLRQQGVAGSELASLLGLSPYRRPIDVYMAKVNPAKVVDTSSWRAEVGTILEPRVMQWYADTTGREIIQPGTLVHPTEPLVIATPDGVSRGPGTPDVVIEVKCPGNRTSWHWGEPGTDDVPDYYYPQVQWELAVTGLQLAHVTVDRGGPQPDIYMVPWDEEMFGIMLETVKAFWQDHVIPRIPPEPDGSDDYGDYIKQLFDKRRIDATKPTTPEIDVLATQLMAMRSQLKVDEKSIAKVEQQLKVFIGDHDGIEGAWGKITWRNNVDGTKTDWKAVAEACNATPEMIEKHTKTTPGARPMRATPPKKDKTHA